MLLRLDNFTGLGVFPDSPVGEESEEDGKTTWGIWSMSGRLSHEPPWGESLRFLGLKGFLMIVVREFELEDLPSFSLSLVRFDGFRRMLQRELASREPLPDEPAASADMPVMVTGGDVPRAIASAERFPESPMLSHKTKRS